MPAATIRSATACAATAGVAMTPIETSLSLTIDSRSSKERTSRPATTSSWRVGSASSSATTRKPRLRNPE